MLATAIAHPDEATLLDIQEQAERMGLVLVTDGRELKYSPAGHIPPGHQRFAIFDKDARRAPDPVEVLA